MKLYLRFALGVLLLLGVVVAAVEALGLPLLTDPSPWLGQGGLGAALIGTGLLLADVVLPVPSSVIMVAYGAWFGVALGALLSVLGSVGAALLGYALGQRGQRWLARLAPAGDRERAERLLRRWGLVAITLSRPVPLLAETVAVLAGAWGLPWWRVALAAALGSLPAALLYALAGAYAVRGSLLLMLALVVLATGVMWLIGRLLDRRLNEPERAAEAGR